MIKYLQSILINPEYLSEPQSERLFKYSIEPSYQLVNLKAKNVWK